MSPPLPEPPAQLPAARLRNRRGGSTIKPIEVKLKVVTPILGGAPATRVIDEVDVIRVPAVRGHLRFWWRALVAHEVRDASELAEREAALWGGRAGEKTVRSQVEIDVRVDRKTLQELDETDIDLSTTRGSYALWPAQSQTRHDTPPAPRRPAGTELELTLRVDEDRVEEVERALRAWILFGGYGSRTRRGLGGLTVIGDDRDKWLPESATLAELERLLGAGLFAASSTPSALPTPCLRGALLYAGASPGDSAETKWGQAVSWLRDFRQGRAPSTGTASPSPSNFARQYGRAPKRPGRSNWPEPDKLRHLTGSRGKTPRHTATPVWPRAAFGLPIQGSFPTSPGDPGEFELFWYDPHQEKRSRLASPLIVKALPLAGGRFVACALWLERAYPQGTVAPEVAKAPPSLRTAGADFDQLLARGEAAHYQPLDGVDRSTARGLRMREAFFGWLDSGRKARRIR